MILQLICKKRSPCESNFSAPFVYILQNGTMRETFKMKADLFLRQHNRHQAVCGYTVGVTRVTGVYIAYVRLLYVSAHNLQEIKKYYLLETAIKCNARQSTTKIRVLTIHPEVDDIRFSCPKYQSVVVAMNPGLGRRRRK